MNRKIVISVNTAWNICNFRSGLVRALVERGYDVMVLARSDEYACRLAALGCRFKLLSMEANGTSPGRDLALLVKYRRVLQSLRPLAFLGYTIKPNVYGSIAANGLQIPVINNIAGLGTGFLHGSLLSCLVKRLYRHALRRSRRVFFQNADDRRLFLDAGLAREQVAEVLPGSGIDLGHFQPAPRSVAGGRGFRFLLVGRLLKDKGVEEFAAAAEIVLRQRADVSFQLLGAADPDNPNAIPAERIRCWEDRGLLRHLARTDDVRPYLAEADCIVLPSYREGVPHSLLEAAAMARPIIATDVAGCRDVVDDGRNGFLCQARSAADLADKMLRMAALAPWQRDLMGEYGHAKVAAQFDVNIVIARYLDAIDEIESGRQQARVLGMDAGGVA
ncbi:glycosyltransferase family 4 protein [Massilia sp. 9I]|uniref:glycosyltransferase family 4 protein n=1 Tax=Massilia sp. 9I TaxID=2653152 RepID=UPI0012F431BB|nr:glycosyltransferase family 4 protein [Massilia sp. 9I]VXB88712.1 Lipid carrier : UDP-N-acetylgalactosaminyltransferase; Putative glycosyltransferase [Massilia sp. 9I]